MIDGAGVVPPHPRHFDLRSEPRRLLGRRAASVDMDGPTRWKCIGDLMERLKLKIGVLALLSGSAIAAAASAASPIEPGLWSYSASTLLTGAKGGEQCVRADQVEDFLTGPHNRHYHCVYPSRSVGDGVVSFAGDCLDKGERNRYHVEARGHYKPESFELQGSVNGVFLGIPIKVPVSIKANRVAATCPAPH